MASKIISYCGKLIRQQDADRFLLSMFAPVCTREALWSLFAFNHEITKTIEVVNEASLGMIRLQWWRDEIAGIYENDNSPGHEILGPLAKAIKEYNLPRQHFDRLIEAREFDLEDALPSNLEGLLNYADFTCCPLMKLAAQITGSDPDMEPVTPIAVNYALCGILRAVPFHASMRRCSLPEELLEKHEVMISDLYDLKPGNGLPGVIKEITEQVIKGIKTDNQFLKSSQNLAIIYRRQIKNNKFNVFLPKMAAPPAFKELRLTLRGLL